MTNGKNAMPAFGGRLSDTDIENVAAFVIDQAEGGKWDVVAVDPDRVSVGDISKPIVLAVLALAATAAASVLAPQADPATASLGGAALVAPPVAMSTDVERDDEETDPAVLRRALAQALAERDAALDELRELRASVEASVDTRGG